MHDYGIPASIILAQGCLESGNGNSRLAVNGNNHFGIKCHQWDGKTIYHDDDKKNECFRKYDSPEESFKDHSLFLSGRERYQSLFELDRTNYKAWAKGLKKAGYATNPKYAKLLIKIIEENNLDQYDKQRYKEEKRFTKDYDNSYNDSQMIFINNITESAPLLKSKFYNNAFDRRLYENNGVTYLIATELDTYKSIAKEYNLFTKELYSFNDFEIEIPIEPGAIIYIQKKKKKGAEKTYKVLEGDTMHKISQIKGIRLKELLKLNNMESGESVEIGRILILR